MCSLSEFFLFFDGSAYAVCGLSMYCHKYGLYLFLLYITFFEFITEYLTMNVFIKQLYIFDGCYFLTELFSYRATGKNFPTTLVGTFGE